MAGPAARARTFLDNGGVLFRPALSAVPSNRWFLRRIRPGPTGVLSIVSRLADGPLLYRCAAHGARYPCAWRAGSPIHISYAARGVVWSSMDRSHPDSYACDIVAHVSLSLYSIGRRLP